MDPAPGRYLINDPPDPSPYPVVHQYRKQINLSVPVSLREGGAAGLNDRLFALLEIFLGSFPEVFYQWEQRWLKAKINSPQISSANRKSANLLTP